MKTKILVVSGEIKYSGSGSKTTLWENLEKAINEFTQSVDGAVIKQTPIIDFGTLTTGGRAVVFVEYEGDIKKEPTKRTGRPPKTDK